MITEEEVIAAVLERHSFSSAEKFIQEVCCRTYWKGWLELHPSLLTQFNEERIALKARLEQDAALRAAVDRAKAGATGIACFDAWVRELLEVGYVHNHARMWFASIWIFTLNLPWQIGADFFYKHLLDADPASNTLSWRWVAGLHTRGKHYLARASNIRHYTGGRFDPSGALNERAAPLTEDAPAPAAIALAAPDPAPRSPVALLLTEEDLHPESWEIALDVRAIAYLASPPLLADLTRPAARFAQGALDDAMARASAHFAKPASGEVQPSQLVDWARAAGASTIVTGYAPVGLLAWELTRIEPLLRESGITLARHRRGWDSLAWPHAKGGFFGLKKHIPEIVSGKR